MHICLPLLPPNPDPPCPLINPQNTKHHTGECIPLRLFLSGIDLTPTYRSVNNRFSVKYYLNLVLVDEEDRRYFKQSVRPVSRLSSVLWFWSVFWRMDGVLLCWSGWGKFYSNAIPIHTSDQSTNALIDPPPQPLKNRKSSSGGRTSAEEKKKKNMMLPACCCCAAACCF